MNRLVRAQRLWIVRRLALLGGSAAAAAAAFGLQVARLRLDPGGAAVHGVALLVTLIVLAILLRLVRLQLGGPSLDAPSWERHVHRASLREAPLVALAGTGVAAFMVLATPRLVVEDRPAPATQIAVQVAEPDRFARLLPIQDVAAAAPEERKQDSLSFRPKEDSTLVDSPVSSLNRGVEVNYRWLDGNQDERQDSLQEPVDPTRPSRDAILRVEPGEPSLPPVHFGIGSILAIAKGDVNLTGDVGRFSLDLDTVRGEQMFEMGIDVTAEFALTPESALKLMYAGVAITHRGHLTEDTTFGSATALNGDPYQFEIRWSHLYMALAKRLTGYTRASVFDLSVHGGAIVDHTLVEFESEPAGVGGESEDGERGWVAPGVGFSASFRGPGPAGFQFELVQSIPVNIGGQSIVLTDVRAGLTADLAEGASIFLGYRFVKALYRLFDAPLVREGGETTADVAVRGPVFGLDFRF